MVRLGFKWLFKGGFQVVKQTIWKEALRPAQKPIHPRLKATEPVPRNQQFLSNQIRRVLIESKPFNGQIKCAWEPLSHRLRAEAVRRLFSPLKSGVRFSGKNGKSYLPYLTFGFVGLALTENNGSPYSSNLISDDVFDDLLQNISVKSKFDEREEVVYPDSLTGYHIDDHLIAKGSYGAIYPAKIAEPRLAETPQNDLVEGQDAALSDVACERWELIDDLENHEDRTSGVSSVSSGWSVTGSLSEMLPPTEQLPATPEGTAANQSQEGQEERLARGEFNLALKIIFNDRIQSDSSAIEAAFESEKILLKGGSNPGGIRGKRRPPHPNIARVHQAFADENISQRLTQAKKLFPHALPRMKFDEGRGRNMLMYLVMHRYEMTLREYLDRFPNRPEELAKLMLCQLLEGAAHLGSLNIAHRDIKDDNILVELDSRGTPRLAIADFGCSVYGGESGLLFRIPWFAAYPMGNKALKAPELKAAYQNMWTPGYVVLDYRKSDGWALGAIAYQICGMENPFYQRGVDSLTYDEKKLQGLQGVISPEFEFVIHGLLRKNPNERLSCREAADMIHLLLWRPEDWTAGPVNFWKFPHLRTDLHGWLYKITQTDRETTMVRDELLATFLSRAQRDGLLRAAKTLTLFKWGRWVQEYAENIIHCIC